MPGGSGPGAQNGGAPVSGSGAVPGSGQAGASFLEQPFGTLRFLKLGMRGEDVRRLQVFLNQDPATRVARTGPGSPGNETALFGPLTEAAVVRFQEKYAADVLLPWGLSAGTGIVGKTTLAKMGRIILFPSSR